MTDIHLAGPTLDLRPSLAPRAGAGSQRVLIYSHDTFGLGHLRRARAIANALVAGRSDTSVLILSGSPVAGSFDFGKRVDFVRIPGVRKLSNGEYECPNLDLSIDEATRLREAIILQTARSFRPDLLIVDKEPTGFRGEILPTLSHLARTGARLVLGLRDVLDEPEVVRDEWARKGALQALDLYDEIWVYGLQEIYEPLSALSLAPSLRERVHYTGYLRRDLPRRRSGGGDPGVTGEPFVLVTTGGGGDGADLVDWVISAYENDRSLDQPALIVFGPFLDRQRRAAFQARIRAIPSLDAITFDAKIEHLMRRAQAVVAMGGYNTFCEILSLDKPALIVPRRTPRLEQSIRALAADRLGLVRMLEDLDGTRDPRAMAEALRALPDQAPPSRVVVPGLLDGLDTIRSRFEAHARARHAPISLPAAE
jgi:predicted glycosyltransferase